MRCRKGGEERGKEEGVVDPAFIHSPWLSFVPPHVLQSRGYLGQARAGGVAACRLRTDRGRSEFGPDGGRQRTVPSSDKVARNQWIINVGMFDFCGEA